MAFLTASWTLDFVVSCILIFSSFYVFYRRKFKYWKKYNIPHTNPKFPFGDMGLNLLSEGFLGVFTRIYNSFKSEKVVGIWFFCSPMLLIRDVDLIRDVLTKDFMHFQGRGKYVNEKDDPLSAHLFHLEEAKWKFVRTKLIPTFTPSKMKMMFPILIECSNAFVDVLDKFAANGEVVEMKEYLARFLTDVAASCAFGIEANSLKNPEDVFRIMGKKYRKPSFLKIISGIFYFNPKLAEFFKFSYTNPTITEFFLNTIKETIEYRKANNIKRNDMMKLLIQLMDEGKIDDFDEIEETESCSKDKVLQKLTFEEVAAAAFSFFLGGYDNSSNIMQFTLYELALNPDIQEKLRAEIKSVSAKYSEEITFEGIYEMELLGRVINESMRKYPHPTWLERKCNKDFKIKETDMIVPKGTGIIIPLYSIHRDPIYYPNPDVFDPDRFKQETKLKRHQYAYIPFGGGPRNCIGMRFALMQMRIGLIKLLSHFKFEICEKSPVPMVFNRKSVFLNPKNGMLLKISRVK